MSEKKIKPRTWLTEGRERLGLDRKTFGGMCGCSEELVAWLENGVTITHPNIAARMVRLIGGTAAQYNMLVAEGHHAKTVPRAKIIKLPAGPWTKRCQECGNSFVTTKREQRYCSISCATIARHRKKREEEHEKTGHDQGEPEKLRE